MNDPSPDGLIIAEQFREQVLEAMKRTFIAKDEVIDLLGVTLVAREHLFILGPPGTAKSALVQDLSRRLAGQSFDYLLTRFTEPNELFGPFDIRKLRDGDLVTNTEGMLPEASFVFLDELLNANSAILNSLLMVLNERVFRRGRETRPLPLISVIGASNRLPEDDALGALFDRFLLRVRCDNVPQGQLGELLGAGWKLDTREDANSIDRETHLSIEDLRILHRLLPSMNLEPVHDPFMNLVKAVREAGISLSDRRAVKLQRLAAASALLCGRMDVASSDLWIFRYIWDTEEQREVLEALVKSIVEPSEDDETAHPRSRSIEAPNAEAIAQDLSQIRDKLKDLSLGQGERATLKDHLGLLAGRIQWVTNDVSRRALEKQLEEIWSTLGETP